MVFSQGLGQILPFYFVFRHHDDQSFHHVPEFPYISRPVIPHKYAHGLGGDGFGFHTVLFGEVAKEVVHQQGNILPPLPQGWDPYGDDVEAKEEVFPEVALFYLLFQVFVGGGDDPDVHGDGFPPPYALEGEFLDYPEDLCLDLQAHVPHFIQEQGPPMGHFEFAPVGRRVFSFFPAKKLLFYHVFGDGGTAHFHKGVVLSYGEGMDLPGHQFLARSALSGDENPSVGGGHQFYLVF